MHLIDCTEPEHGPAILDILNDAILTSTALYDYKPRPPEAMAAWFATKRQNGFPVIGAVDGDGRLIGFANWGTFRAFPAYKYTVEHSVYVHRDHRGKGLGRVLLERIVALAGERDVHVLVGGIDAANGASIELHRRLGFEHAGTVRQAGFKFGRWLDLAFYQLILQTPAAPVDG
ncbi:GNAT family N-acetyltransferase [Piscinibacter terrae]|uniref:N-acetyltransferase n=1 Tax=Piscinibacter terrae TaxID=2496871 RepID=A0A3N7K1J4_9BURK|nr:GNAT family N-acetyltransferase [Albitalea terrae]RQP26849.1 N-acetyltransferase [Albitalea terrae]